MLQTSLLRGETEGLPRWSQYNPHGVFIALENAGYFAIGISLLFAGVTLSGQRRLERAVRRLFVVSGGAITASLPVLALAYGRDLEYLYEVAAVSISWITLIVGGLMLWSVFRSAPQRPSP